MFGADGKCVSRLHSAETWESGQPVTRPTKWAKHRIKMISGGGFASSEFCISTKPLRLEQQICENNAARIWIISTEYFFEVFANCSLFRRMPIVAGCSLIWLPRGHNNGDHDKDGSLEWSPSNSSYHQATVNQIALTQKHEPMGRRQQTRRGGNECEMSHFTFATFAFYPLQSSESFWGALLVADWRTVREAVLPTASSAGDAYSNKARRDCQMFFTSEHHLYYRCGWATIHRQLSTSYRTMIIPCDL